MADRFLAEVNRIHQLRRDARAMSPQARAAMIESLGRCATAAARSRWLFLGGRGTGKSYSMSAAVHMAVRAGISRFHLIAPTMADFHDVNLEGRSGILATCGRNPRPRWVSSKRRPEWPSGAVCVCFSGEEPDSLRGPQCELCVVDEIARMRYQQQVFDMAMMGLRLGDKPRLMVAPPPRTTPFMKKLVTMTGVSITTGSTYDNVAHLSAEFLKRVRELYERTRLGRQELQGAMILDPVNALIKDEWLVHDDVAENLIEQVTVGVDRSGGGDEIAIVAAARLNDGRYAVLADRTIGGSPAQWGEAAVKTHDDLRASRAGAGTVNAVVE